VNRGVRAIIKRKKREELTKPQETQSSCGFFFRHGPVSFRSMNPADLDEVMLIERSAFRYPWSARFFLQELQVQCARSILAEADGKILGYILFWLLPGEIDVHNLAVHSGYRRRGIARSLLQEVIAEARAQSRARLTLEVRQSNLPAQKLYQSLGFVTIGIRKGYYSDDGEDAFAMALELTP
jgi:[ribosomal protein S18]-alanine N-acetyltransferase